MGNKQGCSGARMGSLEICNGASGKAGNSILQNGFTHSDALHELPEGMQDDVFNLQVIQEIFAQLRNS